MHRNVKAPGSGHLCQLERPDTHYLEGRSKPSQAAFDALATIFRISISKSESKVWWILKGTPGMMRTRAMLKAHGLPNFRFRSLDLQNLRLAGGVLCLLVCAGVGSLPSVSLRKHLILDNRVVSSRGFLGASGKTTFVWQRWCSEVLLREGRGAGGGQRDPRPGDPGSNSIPCGPNTYVPYIHAYTHMCQLFNATFDHVERLSIVQCNALVY